MSSPTETLVKPSDDNIAVIKDFLEELMQRPALRVLADKVLISVHFPQLKKLPTDITEFREDLLEKNFLFFYNNLVYKGAEVVSMNFTKIKRK